MRKATRQQLRFHNKHLVLKTIYHNDKISRADIARLIGLTRTTVSELVSNLIKERLVKEVGHGKSHGGKAPILLSLDENSHYLIGVDLADSEFRGAVVNLRGEIKHRLCLPINNQRGEMALGLVYQLIDKLINLADNTIAGIGIGTPGLLDIRRGMVLNAVNLGWQRLPLGDLLKDRYKLPVYISNDSQAAALAEFTFGENKNIPNLIVIKIGRGTGAGIVLNRQLYFGDGFGAGEIGHVVVSDNGELCQCGNRGCLETVTNSRFILKRAREIFNNNPDSLLNRFASSPDEINIDVVSKALESRDEKVRLLISEVGHYLAIAVANLIGALNIQRVVIAGTLTRLGPALLEPIRQEVQRLSFKALAEQTSIEISKLGPDIVVLGAAALVLNNELGLP
jgi:glucokinase-like ROK family protein